MRGYWKYRMLVCLIVLAALIPSGLALATHYSVDVGAPLPEDSLDCAEGMVVVYATVTKPSGEAATETATLVNLDLGTTRTFEGYLGEISLGYSGSTTLPIPEGSQPGDLLQYTLTVGDASDSAQFAYDCLDVAPIQRVQNALDEAYEAGDLCTEGYDTASERLTSAQAALDRGQVKSAVNKLSALIHYVEAQSGFDKCFMSSAGILQALWDAIAEIEVK